MARSKLRQTQRYLESTKTIRDHGIPNLHNKSWDYNNMQSSYMPDLYIKVPIPSLATTEEYIWRW
jgi:hypothetical protein